MGSKMSLVGLYINVIWPSKKIKLEIIKKNKNDWARSLEKWQANFECNIVLACWKVAKICERKEFVWV